MSADSHFSLSDVHSWKFSVGYLYVYMFLLCLADFLHRLSGKEVKKNKKTLTHEHSQNQFKQLFILGNI